MTAAPQNVDVCTRMIAAGIGTKIGFCPMPPAEQRIKIAELCGWKDIGWFDSKTPVGTKPGTQQRKTVPNYPDDLNAMHEAERMLDRRQCRAYKAHLVLAISREIRVGNPIAGAGECYHATAKQKAIAFLRAVVSHPEGQNNPIQQRP